MVNRSRGHVISDRGAAEVTIHVAEGRSTTKPEGTFYSVYIDTEINQSDWFRKLNFFSF